MSIETIINETNNEITNNIEISIKKLLEKIQKINGVSIEEISNLKRKEVEYIKEIDLLKNNVEILTVENESLKNEKLEMTKVSLVANLNKQLDIIKKHFYMSGVYNDKRRTRTSID